MIQRCAMISSFAVSLIAISVIKPRFAAGDLRGDAWVMLVTVATSTIVWLVVTFATQPEPDRMLESFYRRVRPGGPGWAAVSGRAGLGRGRNPRGAPAVDQRDGGIVAVNSSALGDGKAGVGDFGE